MEEYSVSQNLESSNGSSIKIISFGGSGGAEFQMVAPKSIKLYGGKYIDRIELNGKPHGGGGGGDLGGIVLIPNEYISSIVIKSGAYVDHVKFITNEGNVLEGGGAGGTESKLEGIRVLALGGNAGKYLDKLSVMYVQNYQPSTVVETNVGFILSYTAPFQTFEEYEDSRYKTVDSYEKTTESMLKQTYSASVEGEYYAKVTASTEIEVTNSSLETVKSELETELMKGTKKTVEITDGHVGILLVNGSLMQGADGTYWMYPTSVLSYTIVELTNIDSVLNHYDLTGELDTQMIGLKPHREIRNGYVYYKQS